MAMLKPCERVLQFLVPSGISYVDISRSLSMINRKQFKQGYSYAIQAELFGNTNAASSSQVAIMRLNHSWVTVNSWVMAMANWRDQQRDAMFESSGSGTMGRYNDFKVYLDSTMSTAGTSILVPCGAPEPTAAAVIDPDVSYDWDYSQFVIPNDGAPGVTGEYYGHLCGPDSATSYGLVAAYADARPKPHQYDPNTTPVAGTSAGGLYEEMEDVGDEMPEILDNLRYRNNEPPYPIGSQASNTEFYPGGEQPSSAIANPFDITADNFFICQDTLIVRAGSTMSTDSTGAFQAYCGLLRLNNSGDDVLTLTIHCLPGQYHGVAAIPMQEVN